ncbi:hypothetical protein KIK06_10000 [Nocardiopsis sp. EMB25]|uniref:hypothetical protein n=1 Tax=Nocardiopsis sp. EMB25 TaxID=2835867 RepID=UPI0022840FCF|nr:hypothetical protein [Nocardiopsis sp. EMB25]MCY9784225.1 hypothetical protein [Nocardiopsis sp. EMB25]
MTRLLHYAPHLFYVFTVVAGTAVWLPPGEWMWALVALAVVTTAGVVLDGVLHRGQLCERCAAKVPLDAGRLAERYERLFLAWHWMCDTLWRWPLILVIVIAGTWPLPQAVAITVQLVLTLAFVWTGDQHMRLRPWCPYCEWDDGGEHEESPVEEPPAPTVGR